MNLLLVPIQKKVSCKCNCTRWLKAGPDLILPDALSRVVYAVILWRTYASPDEGKSPKGKKLHCLLIL